MKRFSRHTKSGRTLLAIALAAGGMMTALPVFAADEVNQERLLNVHKEPGNWLHHHQNYSAHRFSTLKEINRDNVKNLKVAWTMHLGGVEGGGIWSHGGLEGTPIAENGFLTSRTAGVQSTRSTRMMAAACWSGRWIPRQTVTGLVP